MQVELDGNIIDIIIIRKNNKNIYFRIKEDLKLYITCNRFVSVKELNKLIMKNKESILKMYIHMQKEQIAASEFYYLGDKYDVIYSNVKSVYFEENKVYTKDDLMLDKFLQQECKKIFSKRVNELKDLFDFVPSINLRIRKMKTRWGVCNRANNTVTLNFELIRREQTLLDYVIIHELCHFKHPNHSATFWNEVSKYYPYYKLARKKLKEV